MQRDRPQRLSSMLTEFDTYHDGWPAKVFASVVEAGAFTRGLTELEVNFRITLIRPRKSIGLPMQTVVLLLDSMDEGMYH